MKSILILLFAFFSFLGNAQENENSAIDELWPVIVHHLGESNSDRDTAFHFMILLVRGHCGTDLSCQLPLLNKLQRRLEVKFNLPAAIFIAKERVAVAKKLDDTETKAAAYRDLSRFYDALGDNLLAAINNEKALSFFEEAGNNSMALLCRRNRILMSLDHKGIEEVVPELESLLVGAAEYRDTNILINLHLDLMYHSVNMGRFVAAKKYIDDFEKIIGGVSDATNERKGLDIYLNRGRGMLAFAEQDYAEANRYFAEVVRLCKAQSSKWLEIDALIYLAEIAVENNQMAAAKKYLRTAQSKSEVLKLNDLLERVHKRIGNIAEAEGDYKLALESKQEELFFKERFSGKGFDSRSFFLELEKEELSKDRERQGLELKLKENQLRNNYLLIGLMWILGIGGILVFLYQQEAKENLAEQNKLIQKQAEELKNLDVSKSRFFANVSHELRTPLSLMIGPISTLLKENHLTPKHVSLLNMAHENGQQLQNLISEILNLGKLEAGKLGLELESTELNAFFKRYSVQFDSLAVLKGIDFNYSFDANPFLVADIDRVKCRQILYNLLSNAFKFTPSGGRINVSLTQMDADLVLEVRNTGKGIHPDDLPQLFDRYFQTNQISRPAEGGTGIGLALCREYVALFGGSISAKSEYGAYALFTIRFPMKGIKQEVAERDTLYSSGYAEAPLMPASVVVQDPCIPSASTSNKPSILIVEDNVDLRSYLEVVLNKKYQIQSVENGAAVFDLGQPLDSFQLILSDVMMPQMDGYQLVERLKSDDATRHIPLVMLTARADIKDKMRALRLGVDDYLLKPFEEEELLARIDNILENRNSRRAFLQTEDKSGTREQVLSEDQKWLEGFEQYIQNNLSNTNLSVPQIAMEFTMSESSLLRKIKSITGLTVVKYIREARLDRARSVLEKKSDIGIAQLAKKVGYSDARNFSRSFKKRFGRLPSEI